MNGLGNYFRKKSDQKIEEKRKKRKQISARAQKITIGKAGFHSSKNQNKGD